MALDQPAWKDSPSDTKSPAVLLVGDPLQPLRHSAVHVFRDGDVRHARGRRGAVPVLHAGRDPDDVAWADLLDRAALPLHPAQPGRHDQHLAERVRVPGRAGARLEGDESAGRTRRGVRREQAVDAHRSGEVLERSSRRGQRANPRDPQRLLALALGGRGCAWCQRGRCLTRVSACRREHGCHEGEGRESLRLRSSYESAASRSFGERPVAGAP